MNKLTLATAILAASTSLAMINANAYQFEVGAGAGYLDPDNGDSGSQFDLGGTYYFNPVQDKNAPLAEAAFVNRASNVSVSATFQDQGDDEEHNRYGAGVEYFVPNSDFFIGGNVAQNKFENDDEDSDNDLTTYGVEVGYLPVPNLLIAAGVKGYEDDRDNDGVDPTLRAKYVTQIGDNAVNLEAGAAFGDLDEYNLAADYFIDNTFSIGADYYSNDLTDNSEFGINARKFISQQTSLEGRVGFGDTGDSDNDYNTFGIAAKHRF
ncbi:putative porin [Acinetobacter sp.]|uniref:putative porin n=1 Tax=Acinetobacter sp. TaxID=472 RepID=UPI0035B3C43D